MSQMTVTLGIKLHLVKSWSETANVSCVVTTTCFSHSIAATGCPGSPILHRCVLSLNFIADNEKLLTHNDYQYDSYVIVRFVS